METSNITGKGHDEAIPMVTSILEMPADGMPIVGYVIIGVDAAGAMTIGTNSPSNHQTIMVLGTAMKRLLDRTLVREEN